MAIDKAHLADAARYVSMNSVRAKLCSRLQDWRWSSVAAHFAGEDDELVEVAPLLERYEDFRLFLDQPPTKPPFAHCAARRSADGRRDRARGLPDWRR